MRLLAAWNKSVALSSVRSRAKLVCFSCGQPNTKCRVWRRWSPLAPRALSSNRLVLSASTTVGRMPTAHLPAAGQVLPNRCWHTWIACWAPWHTTARRNTPILVAERLWPAIRVRRMRPQRNVVLTRFTMSSRFIHFFENNNILYASEFGVENSFEFSQLRNR